MDYDSEDSYDNIPFEPMILINDGEEENDDAVTETDKKSHSALTDPKNPDISIMPIKRKKPLFKIKLFDKKPGRRRKNSYSDDESFDEQSSEKRSGSVRIVSEEEAAEHASEPYQKRKSLPLEQCPICKKFFRRMATHLLKHEFVDRNPEDGGLLCNFCNKSFNTQSNLLIHLRTHTGLRPYVCEVCSKGFSQSCNLVNHMRIHSGERPYKCPHCDKAFTQSGNLNNHIRLHTNEKPFKCHFCDRAFVQSGNLSSHIKNNHDYRPRKFVPDTETSLSESILNQTV